MREILFRGKRLDNGEWVEGCYVYTNSGRSFIKINKPVTPHFSNDVFEVIPETIGQYTGLTDKNGTKIFEGDIVKGKTTIGYVSCSESEFKLNWNSSDSRRQTRNFIQCVLKNFGEFKSLEVISNIHDNPELLEESEDTPPNRPEWKEKMLKKWTETK